MKIGILTWSKVVNHGAVLQAYASQQTLLSLGHTPVMLDYQENKNGMHRSFVNRLKNLNNRLSFNALKTHIRLPEWDAEKTSAFTTFRDSNMFFGSNYTVAQNLNAVMIGSDMVFDFFEGYNPFMYGKDVNAPYLFSYAACFGCANERMFLNFAQKDEIIHYIGKLNGIGYRDDNTYELLTKCCGIDHAVKNIDPVLLYGFSEEAINWDTGKWKNRKYVLVYAYTYNMDKKEEISAIKALSRAYHMEIISVGYMHNWCDESINADPKEFVELFRNASFVVTDTFHGTVFSLIFGKQFCSIVRNNAFKVVDLLNEFGLEYLLDTPPVQRISCLPSHPIDYKKVNARLNNLRKYSIEYIQDQILKAQEIKY